jgi:hypothetical protein
VLLPPAASTHELETTATTHPHGVPGRLSFPLKFRRSGAFGEADKAGAHFDVVATFC